MGILKGIRFAPIWGASGVQGFFGEGYWFHTLFKPFGLSFKGMTFVAKTVTHHPRKGNLPLRDSISPREWFPRCIRVKPLSGVTLNAVGLSNPGFSFLLHEGKWQVRQKPFFLSFMSTAKTKEERLLDLEGFIYDLKDALSEFDASIGLQINVSCPNTGLDTSHLQEEMHEILDCCASIPSIPVILKINVLLPPQALTDIVTHKSFSGICVSNTIPWGSLSQEIDWNGYFGTNISPLHMYGGGGLGGKPLLPLVVKWVKEFKDCFPLAYVNAGGGILCPKDLFALKFAGANSVFIGSMVMLRPWRVSATIKQAYALFA